MNFGLIGQFSHLFCGAFVFKKIELLLNRGILYSKVSVTRKCPLYSIMRILKLNKILLYSYSKHWS